MGKEIERKFLVKSNEFKKSAVSRKLQQGYLNSDPERVVRVRTADDQGFLTVKGISIGASRTEYEYPIPFADAQEMLNNLCELDVITKTRFNVSADGNFWEIDEFHGSNEGLIVAEIELKSIDQGFCHPGWLGEEVTGDPKYYNSNLIRTPFKDW